MGAMLSTCSEFQKRIGGVVFVKKNFRLEQFSTVVVGVTTTNVNIAWRLRSTLAVSMHHAATTVRRAWAMIGYKRSRFLKKALGMTAIRPVGCSMVLSVSLSQF